MNSKEHAHGLIVRVQMNSITAVNKWEITSILCVHYLQRGYADDLNTGIQTCECVLWYPNTYSTITYMPSEKRNVNISYGPILTVHTSIYYVPIHESCSPWNSKYYFRDSTKTYSLDNKYVCFTYDLSLSQRWLWRVLYILIQRRVVCWNPTDVSEAHVIFIFRF